jgi:hypothetical protein
VASPRAFTKGCGFAIVVWLLLMGGYAYLTWQRIGDPMPAVLIGVLGGTFAGIFLSSFIGLFTGRRDRAALRRALAGNAPRDGRIEAASGPIRPLDRPLEAPFTGQPCVAYEYDIKRNLQGASDFAGVAMAPCAIETVRGRARVLGWSTLDQFPAVTDERIDRARGARYLSSASFEPLGVTSMLSTFGDLLTDDDGTIRKDFKIEGEGVDLEGRRIQERALPVGAVVTILGRWSESRGGFAAAGPASMNRLFAGDLASTRLLLSGDALKRFGIASFFFVVMHAFLGVIYFAAPRASAGSVWDERDCDNQKKMLAHGADPNERGRDAITPLMNAARMDEPDCVRHLVAAGARLEATDKWGDTALGHAVVAGRDENAAILLAAGAKDFRVTESTGTAIGDDAAPLAAVKEYIEAVHRGDFPTMARLMAHASVRRMEDMKDDLPLWQSMRPRQFTVEHGWMTPDAATIAIRGATPRGERRAIYHLARQPDGWQIQKEWFPDDR